mmetsp:Transcript_9580/g.15923  ORF Transcript_9580/g.15923 Transcript_9580/m.15923 type:complete len:301 (-) Transcript_9580:2104-3006(-)
MAQEKHCWLVRRHPTIRRIFENGVFCADDGAPEPCCVSLDGCAALFRPAVSGLKTHVDLVPGLEGSDWGSVQGAYNLYEVNHDEESGKANAGFVCVVGSHRQYEAMWKRRESEKGFKKPTKHWHVLEPDSPLQEEARLILSPANSLVLWRSDLLHKNYGGDYTPQELGSEEAPRLPRFTQFITFSPKKFRTQEMLQRKASSVVDGCCNNHWAALAVRVPITPFPAWSAAAKKIRIIRPSFKEEEDEDEQGEEDEKSSREEGGNDEADGQEANNKKRKRGAGGGKKMSNLDRLPRYVQELL